MLPAGFRRPPAAPARRVLPAGFRRPPPRLPGSRFLAAPHARACQADRSFIHQPDAGPATEDVQYDREVVAAITAGDPAGMAMAYDRYAAALYGYCHWMLHDSADAAGALKDTFVIAAATLRDLSEPSELRPWLFALARNECRRRIRPMSAARDEEEAGAATSRPMWPKSCPMRTTSCRMRLCSCRAVGRRPASDDELSDATVQFRAVGRRPASDDELFDADDELSDATVQFFRAVGRRPASDDELSDATVQFRAV